MMTITRELATGVVAAILIAATPAGAGAQTYEKGVQEASPQPAAGRVAYVLGGRLWVGPLAGGRATLVPTEGLRVGSPVLSPDARTVVHLQWSEAFHRTSIVRRDVATGTATVLLSTTADVGVLIDAHFGRRTVAYSEGGKGVFEIGMDGGGTPRVVTKHPSDRAPRYSSDGRQVAFIRALGDSQDVFVAVVESGAVRRVQTSVAAGEIVDWSPDDRQLVFESFDTGAMELWSVAATGGAARRITDDVAQDHWPSWGSDGAVYVQKNRRLVRIDIAARREAVVALESALPPVASPATLVKGSRVLDLETGRWSEPRDLLIEQGTIAWVAPAGSRTAPAGATVVDAQGLYAIPGLIDMHVHYNQWMGPLLDRYGVTTIKDMGSDPGVDWILDERQMTRDGHLPGPTIRAAGPVMNGSGTGRIGQVLTERLDILRATINWLADSGMDHIKIGSENTEATLATILETAHARKLEVWGHIAIVPVRKAIALGQDGIEHLRGLGWGSLPEVDSPVPVPRKLTGMRRESAAWWDVTDADVTALAKLMVEKKVGWDATLTVMRTFASTALPADVRAQVPPAILSRWDRNAAAGPQPGWGDEDSGAFDSATRMQARFLKAFYDAGGPLLTGSDVGPDFVVPGLAIHQEMSRFVSMGVAPIDALRAATSHAARALKVTDRAGAIAPGLAGDVVLLAADPIANIDNTKSIRWVISRGRVAHAPTSDATRPATGASPRPR